VGLCRQQCRALTPGNQITGVGLNGLEYVTVKHTINTETKLEVTRSHDIFYQAESSSYYAAPFGPEGRGIKHEYYDVSGNQIAQPRWDLPQGNWFSSGSIGSHGMYSGPGSVSYTGFGDYDFSWERIDKVDEISYKHDVRYSRITDRYWNFLEDTRTVGADNAMVRELMAFTGSEEFSKVSGETQDATIKAQFYIGILADYKDWKINKLEKMGLNPYDPDDMKQVTIDDYANFWSSGVRWFKYLILKGSAPSGEEETRDWKSLEEQ